MSKSLLEQLPRIVADGRAQAERILEGLEGKHRIGLQTREWVLPSKDVAAGDWIAQAQRRAQLGTNAGGDWTNRLIYGDNLLAMAALLAGDANTPSLRGKVDLIYIDPPFDSKADYRTKVTLPGVELEQRPTVIEQFAYSDTWSDGTASYLRMISTRLILLRELLSETGQMYAHLDWHISHYVKLVLDDIFGKDNFRNEIVWCYSGGATPKTDFPRKHDVLLRYAKGSRWTYRPVYRPYAENTQQVGKVSTYNSGKRENLDIDLDRGTPVTDWWTDVKTVTGWAADKLDYQTQKPPALLERILETSSNKGDLVLDLFGGSGTTAAVAERMQRRWITGDLGKPACMMMRKRLIDQGAKPFLYQAVGDYQIEAAKSHFGRSVRIGDLSDIVLSLYGALPLPVEDNPTRNLGSVVFGGVKTLVMADSPSKITGVATLRKAVALRDNLLGGWDQVVVLGWNFEPAIGQDIAALNDDKLKVLVVPPDLLDRLGKKGSVEKLRGQVRFASLQYLTVNPIQRVQQGEDERIRISLANYVLLRPEAISLDDDNRAKLHKVMNAEPLALIEYWAVDPDYDGELFRSVWQDYRGNTANDGDALRVVTEADFSVPRKAGERRVCVRVVDVFGFEAEVVQRVAEPPR